MTEADSAPEMRIEPQPVIHDTRLQTLLSPLKAATGLVLAVSGGPDSLALMVLVARWRELDKAACALPIYVACVDHGLRAEAAHEARAVSELANKFGFPARVLVWDGDKPQQSIQEEARAARYRLLEKAAEEWSVSHIVTAHHLDDQAETVLMRLANGSGVSGLAAMRFFAKLPSNIQSAKMQNGSEQIILARPLLSVSKAQLEGVVREAGLSAVDDPSNQNARFTRVRLRHMTAERKALGLSADRLAVLSQRCARADAALASFADKAFTKHATVSDACNQIHFGVGLWDEPAEIVLRCVGQALRMLAGDTDRKHIPLERLERLIDALQEARVVGRGVQRTLHGMIVGVERSGGILVKREPLRRRGKTRISCEKLNADHGIKPV